ncbi:MAG: glycosyltransferase [Candidatus Bathyarchaeota archaeon]|nr:glycosyltransferase [Candidatus Bathyarchaeota archaeon]
MKVLLAIDAPITYSEAPSSRLIYIARSLKKEGLKVELIGRKGEEVAGLKITPLPNGKYISRLILPFLIAKKMFTEKYTHVIIRGAYLAFFLIPLKIFNRKIILDFHDWNFREIRFYYEKTLYNILKSIFYYLTERTATKCSDLIICASKGLRYFLTEEEREKSVILENGLDLTEAEKAMRETKQHKEELLQKYGIPKNKPLAAFFGHWEKKLDIDTMFEGCKKAGINLIVVGEGPDMERYKRNYENVIFTGRLPKLLALELISLSDVSITPYKEDVGKHGEAYYSTRKVKDYLGLGKPIIMANVKGREDFLKDHENAIFYRPGSSDDLAEKIKMVLSDDSLREKISKNNLGLARKFDWHVLVKESGLIEKLSKI